MCDAGPGTVSAAPSVSQAENFAVACGLYRVAAVPPASRSLLRPRARRHAAVCASTCTALALALTAEVAHADPSSTATEQGYELGEVQHPRAVAMGGAQQAWGGSTNAIFANPANMTALRVYHLEAIAAFGPEARRQSYGGAITDSSTSRLAGGFGGTWSQLDPDGVQRRWTDLRLALAYPFGDRLSFGLTGRYLRLGQGVARGPLGASLASDGTRDEPVFNAFTFDAGAGLQITEQLRLGVSGRNLTAPGTSLAPVVVAGGLGWSNRLFTIEADAHVDFTTRDEARARAMLGGEVLLADHFPVRAGYRYDDVMKTHAVSAGAGYVDRRFSIDLGGRRDIVAEHPSTMISVGLRFFIDSGGVGGSDASAGDGF